jgi:hypothetical protein
MVWHRNKLQAALYRKTIREHPENPRHRHYCDSPVNRDHLYHIQELMGFSKGIRLKTMYHLMN